jgi:hypothetical protein
VPPVKAENPHEERRDEPHNSSPPVLTTTCLLTRAVTSTHLVKGVCIQPLGSCCILGTCPYFYFPEAREVLPPEWVTNPRTPSSLQFPLSSWSSTPQSAPAQRR